jgi:hypothetical protein
MNKRLMILILIILSIGVTYYIEVNKKEVSMETRAKVEAELAQDPTFPARPVWWEKGHLLGVGVIYEGKPRDDDARRVCHILDKYGVTPATVQVFDVLKIQNEDNWDQVGAAVCSK